MEQFINK